ncbi:MAG: ABC transporter permease subunit [Enterococcus gilvus]
MVKLSSKTSYYLLFLTAFVLLLPMLFLVLWSFSDQWMYPSLFPEKVSLKSLNQMRLDPSFFPAVVNSFFIAIATTLISLLIAMPAAKYFSLQKLLAPRWIEVMIYLPLILPAIAIVTSTQTLFLQVHLTGTFFGIILIHTYFCLPYAMQILLESYRQLGEGYQLTAESLGAKPWAIFWSITWPLMRPGLTTAASLVFIVSFSQYLPTFFIGGGKIITLPLLLLPYANNGRFGLASMYSVVFLLCTMLGVFILKKTIGGVMYGTER